MNKRKLLVLIISSFLIVLFSSVAWASQNIWSKSEKIEGTILVQNYIITKIPGEKERNEVINSIDPVTGVPLKSLGPAIPLNKEDYEQISIDTEIDGESVALTFDVVYKDKQPVIITNNDKPYLIFPIPYSKQTVIQYRENLYIVDVEEKTMNRALLDEVGPYEMEDTAHRINQKQLGASLVWGTYPSFSPDGRNMVYYTNRDLAFGEMSNGELWLKDWETDEERFVSRWISPIIGWGKDNELFVAYTTDFDGKEIIKINVITGEETTIANQIITYGFSYPYFIFQKNLES